MKQLLAFAGALTLAFIIVAVSAKAPTAQTGPNALDAVVQDAKTYANDYGVSLEEAVRQLRLQDEIGKLGAALEENEPSIFSGMYTEHEPRYRVVVRSTRGGEETTRRYAKGTPLENIVVVQTAEATLAQLEEAQSESMRIAELLGIAVESDINVTQNRVELYVLDKDRERFDDALREQIVSLPENLEIITVDRLSVPDAN